MVDKLKLSEVADVYGALNDVGISSKDPRANRRSLTTTAAISEVIAEHYTADILRDKNEFLGVVLASIPTVIPSLASKSQKFSTYSSTFQATGAGTPIFYKYKVLIPELEMRCLDLAPDSKQKKGALSPAQAINTMSDVGLDVSLYNAEEGVRAIQGGTLVMVNFEDLARMKGPKITAIYKKVFEFQLGGTELPLSDKHSGAADKKINRGAYVHPKNKGTYQYITKTLKRGRDQYKGMYKGVATGSAGKTVEILNGELEATGLLATDPTSGTQLIKDAMPDFLAMKAAFEAKFPGKKLQASGYRLYERQIYFYECHRNNNCNNGNLAALPGRSNHGWGAALDLDTEAAGYSSTNSDQFRWLNKFGKEKFNFVYTVGPATLAKDRQHRKEKWHMDWVGFNAVVTGITVKSKRGWPVTGAKYAKITFAPGEAPDEEEESTTA